MKDPDHKEPVKLDAYGLRELAEAASAARGPEGDPYYVVTMRVSGGPELSVVHGRPGDIPPLGTMIELDTRSQQPDRPAVTYACIASGPDSYRLDETYDAVFWSEAAVEKFLFPYYASKSMWKAARHLSALSDCWYKGRPAGSPAPGGEEVNEIPFAIGHVPDSQFVPLPGDTHSIAAADGRDLHFLFRKPDGTVYPVSLADLIAEPEAEGPGTADPATRSPASGDGA